MESFPSDQYVLTAEIQDTAAAELDLRRSVNVSAAQTRHTGLVVNDTWVGITGGKPRIIGMLCMFDVFI